MTKAFPLIVIGLFSFLSMRCGVLGAEKASEPAFSLWDERRPFPRLEELSYPEGAADIVVHRGGADGYEFLHDSAAIACQPSAGDAPPAAVAGRPQVPLAGEWNIQFVQEPGDPLSEVWEPKLVELPKVVRIPVKPGPDKQPVYKSGAWLQRDAAIPADWQGRRIVLRARNPKIAAEYVRRAISLDGRNAAF